MSVPRVDPLDWSKIQPYMNGLLTTEPTSAAADAWLQQWSDLAPVLFEAQMSVNRRVTEHTMEGLGFAL